MNVFTFSGRLGRDAETKYSQSGIAITTFSVAVDCGYGDNKKTAWVRCKVFKREALGQHLTKGKSVICTGEYTVNEWTDNEGNRKSMPEVNVNRVDFQQGNQQEQQQHNQGWRDGENPQSDANGQIPF